jgi:hypothetical protein
MISGPILRVSLIEQGTTVCSVHNVEFVSVTAFDLSINIIRTLIRH